MGSARIENVVIVGSGPAGLTAAIYAARAGLNPVVLCGADAGGQLMSTSGVENYPGFSKAITGPKLMDEMLAQATHCGAKLLSEDVDAIDANSKPISVSYAGGMKLHTRALIFATGASPRRLGVPGEAQFSPPLGTGVHTCAVCDGALYRKQDVAVAGGGDRAMEDAINLANLCSSVTVIHRQDEFRASKVMLDRARANPVIKWELNQLVDEALGDPHKKPFPVVTSLRLKDAKTGATKELKTDALFVAIGHVPATELLRGQVDCDSDGYIKVNSRQETNILGIYSAGDCHDRLYRQAVTAAGMGCIAALEVQRYVAQSR